MPDIGLLQGPPRPRSVVVAPPNEAPAPVPPPAVPPTLIPLAGEAEAIKVAAHASVVSDRRPLAVVSASLEPKIDPEPVAEPVEDPPLVAALAGFDASACVVAPASILAPASVVAPDSILASEPVAAPASVAAPAAGEPDIPAHPSVPAPPVSPAPFTPSPIRVADLLWLLLALVLIIGTGLGIRDPWPADEPRFASLARDMVHSGEWLFPRVGGDLYQDKPPLFFWLLAASYLLFGSVKASFLVPAFLAAAGVLFLLYDFGRRTAGRESGLAAAIITLCSLQFVLAFRGAQIDPVLCLLTTFSLYALLRHLLLGDGWRWYLLAGFAAGLGIITKGVGFLPLLVLLPYALLRMFGWRGLASLDAGTLGWRWWLAPLAMLLAVSLWFVPMLLAASQGAPEYAAYRDEILFKQTVGRYAAAWHHVKAWYYFLVEVVPPLWLPWSVLLFWLVPKYKAAFQARDARVWLPLGWVLVVLVFFSLSPGKRGIYILPALPALAMASLPVLGEVLARRGVRIASWVLGLAFFAAALVMAVGHAAGARFAVEALADANLASPAVLYVYLLTCAAGLIVAYSRAPLLAWPAALAALAITFSYLIAPAMNGERSGKDFVARTLAQLRPGEVLGLVAYKEQFLLYLDRPTVNFGHRRWQEGSQEFYDAAAWLNVTPNGVLLVPEQGLAPQDRFLPDQDAVPCFTSGVEVVGVSSSDHWFLARPPAEAGCAEKGDARRAIGYANRTDSVSQP